MHRCLGMVKEGRRGGLPRSPRAPYAYRRDRQSGRPAAAVCAGRGSFVRSELPEGGPRVANYEAVSQRIDDLCETIEDLNQRVERLETQGQSPGRKVGEPARSQRRGAPKR